MTGDHYDKQGKVVPLMEWAKLMEDWDYRRIGLWKGKVYRVSTVWLGLDHNWGNGEPLIFETMVFKGKDSMDLDMERYSTLEQAQGGHKAMVAKWKRKEDR